MIASCWDWPSLKYAYFVIEDMPLDAGGWSPTRGIVAKQSGGNSDEVVAFDDCVPSLPVERCYFAGSGDFCVGELFVKRDKETRPQLDMDLVKSQGTPDMRKVIELLEGTSVSAVGNARGSQGAESSDALGPPRSNPMKRTLWSYIVPSVAAAGTGFAMYRMFGSAESSNQSAATIFFAWASGLAVGLAVGQEYATQPFDEDE